MKRYVYKLGRLRGMRCASCNRVKSLQHFTKSTRPSGAPKWAQSCKKCEKAAAMIAEWRFVRGLDG